MNPYELPNAIKSDGTASKTRRFRSSLGSALALSAWGIGTFLISLFVFVDYLLGARLPGIMIYVAFVLGPILGVGGAIATKHRTRGKIYLIIATLCLLPIQIIIVGLMLISISGLEGTQ